ncbi:MAG: sigma-70 family RNA polymerase sigma factor [Pirellulaceae bacterium]|nr:sigma-70 family RNA polymerase sigma factor [Planctomycetales bacterium]
MSASFALTGSTSLERERSTTLELLQQTQSYLKQRLANKAPDAVLTNAWETFYEVYSGVVRRFAVAQGLRGSDVDDCLQEVWVEVAERLVDFEYCDARPGLRAWLYAIVRSKAADLLRRRLRRQTQSLDPIVGSAAEPIGDLPGPHVRLERSWHRSLVQTLLSKLKQQVSDVNYQVISLRFIHGLGIETIARRLDIAPEQVRYRQHRMLRKLRTMQNIYIGHVHGY